MSPWVTGSSSQVLRVLEVLVVWESMLELSSIDTQLECQLQTSHFLGPGYGLVFEFMLSV